MAKTLTGAEHQQMLHFKDALNAALSMAATERPDHQYEHQESSLHDSEIAWVVRERRLMLDMANQHRAQLGLDGVTEDEVYAIEQSAAGHSDYAHKFTLRLAMLVHGVEWRS